MNQKISWTLVLFGSLVSLLGWANLLNAQEFDEKFEHWPVNLKIKGTVIACSGSVPEDAESYIERRFQRESQKAVVINLGEESDFSEDLISQANSPKTFTLESEDSLSSDLTGAVAEATIVLISSPGQLSRSQSKLISTLLSDVREVVESRDGLLCVTGGAVELLGRLQQESIGVIQASKEVANIIPDTLIRVNYTDDTQRPEILSVLGARPRLVGIGIPAETAIVLNGRKIMVMGVSKVTFALMANENLPLRIQHVGQAKSRRPNPYEHLVDLTAWRRDAIDRTLEDFPASEPPVPHVANGTLIIVGGGGMPNGLMERLVELAGGKKAKLVYVPCSEADELNGPMRTVQAWKAMGVESATYIHTKDRVKANSDPEFLKPLEEATGIWFGGGRQWNFADSYYGTKAHELMKKVLERGGVIGGSSAGASVQGRYMCRANPVANFDIMAPGYERGLGFIGGVAIDQHFTQRGRQKDMTQLVGRYPQLLGIGLDEATAIVVTKSRADVVGRGKVHFYNRNEPVFPDRDDFTAITDGQAYDLELRKVIDQ